MRDRSIDTTRGLAAVAVVLVHTTLVYGAPQFQPQWLQQIFYMIGVPIFLVLSGATLTSHGSIFKAAKALVEKYFQYLLFIAVVYIVHANYVNYGSYKSYLNWALFQYTICYTPFGILCGSMWFIPIFIMTMLLGMLSLMIDDFKRNILLAICFVCTLFTYVPDIPFYKINYRMDTWTVQFYYTLLLLGMQLKRLPMRDIGYIGILSACLLFVYLDRFSLFPRMFPTDITYLIYALPSVVLFMAIRSKQIVIKPLAWMGRSAIWIYLSQGVATSLVYWIIFYTNELYYPLNILANFTFSFTLTIVIAWTFKYFWDSLKSLKIKRRKLAFA